ncbi:MAG: peroxiredoxin [Synechococcales bacterium]|nr:peroxiredoxin [Synechococcales bacterium]
MALSVGMPAPAFTAQDTHGNTVSLSDFVGKTVVLYFYPKDDTPGCTKEACSFRDSYDQYLSQGIPVLGVSRDDKASHQAFTEKFNLPFPLLADTDGAITNAYDVAGERNGFHYSLRVTYVIGSDGMIQQVYDAVQTETHATDILAALGV